MSSPNHSLLLSGATVKAALGGEERRVELIALGLFLGIFVLVGLVSMLAGVDSRDGDDWERHYRGSSNPIR
jgi:hypothetical protein